LSDELRHFIVRSGSVGERSFERDESFDTSRIELPFDRLEYWSLAYKVFVGRCLAQLSPGIGSSFVEVAHEEDEEEIGSAKSQRA
jgi:hypothetical protein